ncbi:MAG TPA: endonuclease domain-containing protein [Devosia sp.]|jgi:very-short-patch-repair endonuclease|uniref:endonuclease domain-containing protein n=1 Tax=Devosia sp. TaxID=1871048 RepID=UPI002F9328C8
MSIARARQLRADQTPAERRFWQIVWSFRKQGYHWRRQVQIGPFYADFACHHAGVVVELDGLSHDNEAAQDYDARRTAYLRSRGYEVLRFSNVEVLSNPESVYLALEQLLRSKPTPHPCPSPQGGGETRPQTGG